MIGFLVTTLLWPPRVNQGVIMCCNMVYLWLLRLLRQRL